MAEYIDREELIRQIICSMTEFVGAPDDVQKHDEQCNYAINMIEDAPVADVAPVVHGRWERTADGAALCTACKRKMNPSQYGYAFCSLCGAIMDGGDSDEAD